ncbi:MAG: DUF5681 domain-containing protein [Nitrospirota bacterium]|nr:DUF5681 domain-containing protein [Nitrospirota bacterium]
MANPNPKPPPKHSRFKKGQSGNPEGGRAHNPAIKALRKITIESYREIIELVLTSDVRKIKAIAEDPKSTGLQVGIAVAFMKAIKNGDYTVIERIAERIVGKIPDEIKIQPMTVNQKVTVIDKTALAKALLELEEEV